MEWRWNPDLPDSTTCSSKQCLHQLETYLIHIPGIKMKGDCSHEIKRCLLAGRKAMTSLESTVKSRDISTKRCRDISTKTSLHLIRTCQLSPYSQICGFSSSHVRTGEWDHKEGWAPKNWCFQTVMLEKMLESPLDCKEIKPAHPKGSQPWIFIGRTDAEAEAPVLWPPDAKSWLIGKHPDARKDWRCWGGEGDDRGWDGWMASPIRWTWIWVSSRRWWRTGKSGVLQSMGSQRVEHNLDWTTAAKKWNSHIPGRTRLASCEKY